MTDFLASIAARSFATTTAIRPRLPSLYVPVRREAVLMVTEAETSAARPPDRATTEARQRDGGRPPAPADSMDSAATVSTAPDANQSPRPLPAHTVQRGDLAPPVAAPTEEIATQAERVPALPARQDEDARESIVEPHVIKPVARLTPQVLPANQAVALSAPVLAGHVASSESARYGLLVPPRITDTLAAELRSSFRSVSTPPLQSGGKAVQQAPSVDAAEPDVHVTIGRIEVRATVENAAARPSRTAPSALSLEEYLRGRAQRGGR